MKNTWTFILIMACLVAFCFVSLVPAEEKGNNRKGKYTYRKVYKACNARGEVDSPKPVLNPDAKTQNQWITLFDNKQFEEFGCTEEWGNLSDKDLLDIFAYLHDHASDSPTPLKCK